tara:strand:+ start:216 stop:524 length:309 start_codon:yes stop_codon:yes gene_type:complete
MKVLKFVKVGSSTNDADEAYYVPLNKVEHIATAATSVVVYTLGVGANVSAHDTVTITCGAGDELAIADKLAQLLSGNASNGAPLTVDANFYSGITTIAYAAV